MLKSRLSCLVLLHATLLFGGPMPEMLNYQGHLTVAGTNFNGTGQFKFALVTHGTNLARQATATATLTNGSLASLTITDSGAGYISPPLVTIGNIPGPPPGTGAVVVATVSGGAVTGLTIQDPGHGYFFAIINIAPPPPEYFVTTLWNDSGSTLDGIEPAVAVPVPVASGLFMVNLGDPNAMVWLDPAIFASNTLWLRIWFSADGVTFQRLTPDQPLTASPYTLMAANAAAAATATTAGSATTAASASTAMLATVAGTATNFSNPLAGDVTGPQGATVVSSVGGQSAANVASGVSAANAATSVNTPGAIVKRDASGNFAVGTITGTFSGNGAALTSLNGGQITSGTVGADQLSSGAAAANLVASGQSAVASGGIVLSEQADNANLISAGYVKIGKLELVPEKWTYYGTGPVPSGTLNSGRSDHSAVWTGTEMIVWGGYNGSYLDDGWRYNPALDTWSAVSRTGAPSPRASHSALWTGTQMIIWGAWDGNEFSDGGGRYNPSTDTWSPISSVNAPIGFNSVTWCNGYLVAFGFTGDHFYYGETPSLEIRRYNPSTDVWLMASTNGAPSPRYNHSAVSTGTELIIWGGEQWFAAGWGWWTDVYADGARYNPVTDLWTPIANPGIQHARAGHLSVWTGTQMLVWAGLGSNDVALTNGERYTLAGNSWSPMTTIGDPGPRSGASFIWSGNRLVIWGGANGYSALNTGARYDPVANTWSATATATAPSARYSHTALWTGNEMITWGGNNWDNYGDHYQEPGGRYNVANNTWTTMSPSPGSGEPGARQQASAVWTGSEMLIWGGEADGYHLHSGGRFNLALNAWSSMSSTGAPSGRINHTAVWTGSEMLVWGGYDAGPTASGGRYNPAADTWHSITLSNAPAARYNHAAVWTGSEMLIWGGAGVGVLFPSYPTRGGRYNPASDLWLPMSTNNAPVGRAQPTAVWTGKDLIVWGGGTLSFGVPPTTTYYNTGGHYSPSTDTWMATPVLGAPTARAGHTAVWTGNAMIIWGGNNGASLNTGARYVSSPLLSSWSALPTSGAPEARANHTVFWDGTHMIIWGGQGAGGSLNSGGRYDPVTSAWSVMSLTGAPWGRQGYSAVWTGLEMLIWGGYDGVKYLDTTYGYIPGRTTFLYLRP